MNIEKFKKISAEEAVKYIQDGMVVGLGTGSTVFYALKKIGMRIKEEELDIVGIPTSKDTEKIAKEFGIPLSDLNEYEKIDVTIDGADEVSPDLNLIKGRGGALLREKIIAENTKKEIIVIDSSKMVDILGTKTPLPVEVIPFSYKSIERKLKTLGCKPRLRMIDDKPFVTDNENYILDCDFRFIPDPLTMNKNINAITGVVENGLFVNLVDIVISANDTGVKIVKKD